MYLISFLAYFLFFIIKKNYPLFLLFIVLFGMIKKNLVHINLLIAKKNFQVEYSFFPDYKLLKLL